LKAFQNYYPIENDSLVAYRVLSIIDTDLSGEIDFSEFLTATVNFENLLTEEKLKLAFNYFDTDRGGSISLEEIKEVLDPFGEVSDKVWR
jgi:calcium-dependent protein kinase